MILCLNEFVFVEGVKCENCCLGCGIGFGVGKIGGCGVKGQNLCKSGGICLGFEGG